MPLSVCDGGAPRRKAAVFRLSRGRYMAAGGLSSPIDSEVKARHIHHCDFLLEVRVSLARLHWLCLPRIPHGAVRYSASSQCLSFLLDTPISSSSFSYSFPLPPITISSRLRLELLSPPILSSSSASLPFPSIQRPDCLIIITGRL